MASRLTTISIVSLCGAEIVIRRLQVRPLPRSLYIMSGSEPWSAPSGSIELLVGASRVYIIFDWAEFFLSSDFFFRLEDEYLDPDLFTRQGRWLGL